MTEHFTVFNLNNGCSVLQPFHDGYEIISKLSSSVWKLSDQERPFSSSEDARLPGFKFSLGQMGGKQTLDKPQEAEKHPDPP